MSAPALEIPNPSILRANQANPLEPFFPTINTFSPIEGINAPTVSTSNSRLYLPEFIYVSQNLPTRTPHELTAYLEHCWAIFTAQRDPTLVLKHPLSELHLISDSALNFQNYFWRYNVFLDSTSVREEYYQITRNIRPNFPDRAVLTPAFTVVYPWRGKTWTVTQLQSRIIVE